ncbi:MAG: hypothetical protein COA69_06720 [Robiginitomaculum sp.]|nr:MAG: hypothetical protein COA69_06720 [Robiginitomaculum sp.]
MKKQPRKDHLLDVASALFNQYGFHQTGIDLIMKQSGVSKTTMYKYFKTKEDLILEILKRRSATLQEALMSRIKTAQDENPDRPAYASIPIIFDATEEWIKSGEFYGCNFVRAASEYTQNDDPIRAYAVQHKANIQAFVLSLLADHPCSNHDDLAGQIVLLLDGAVVSAQVRNDANAVQKAKAILSILLAAP